MLFDATSAFVNVFTVLYMIFFRVSWECSLCSILLCIVFFYMYILLCIILSHFYTLLYIFSAIFSRLKWLTDAFQKCFIFYRLYFICHAVLYNFFILQYTYWYIYPLGLCCIYIYLWIIKICRLHGCKLIHSLYTYRFLTLSLVACVAESIYMHSCVSEVWVGKCVHICAHVCV